MAAGFRCRCHFGRGMCRLSGIMLFFLLLMMDRRCCTLSAGWLLTLWFSLLIAVWNDCLVCKRWIGVKHMLSLSVSQTAATLWWMPSEKISLIWIWEMLFFPFIEGDMWRACLEMKSESFAWQWQAQTGLVVRWQCGGGRHQPGLPASADGDSA